MREHGSITPMEALGVFHCFRLGARIWDLKQRGFKIARVLESAENQFGQEVRFARYFLREDEE
jgi:hypothetical protein